MSNLKLSNIFDTFLTIFHIFNILQNFMSSLTIFGNTIMSTRRTFALCSRPKNLISATTDYSSKIICSVEKENIFGTQFHPEKSDKIGLQLIENFINL